mmetsp:Transcript_39833/g.93384  ORF Transcript_39833/g.93384 Transcript_39833/m.93384 type:complete len:914 (+) Transcript_39833:2292-5033(+)
MQSDVCIIRYLQTSENMSVQTRHIPKPVAVCRNPETGHVRVTDLVSNETITDGRMDSPVYVCVFGGSAELEHCHLKDKYMKANGLSHVKWNNNGALLCQSLSIDALERGDSRKVFMHLKASGVLKRHAAFVLLVSRNYQNYIFYNLHPNILRDVVKKFTELEERCRLRESNEWISKRVATVGFNGIFSGHSSKRELGNKKIMELDENENAWRDKNGVQRDLDKSAGHRNTRILPSRPKLTIRRPKLIGSSSEGGAMQAVKASRARARAKNVPRPRKPSLASSSSKSQTENYLSSIDSDQIKSSSSRDVTSSSLRSAKGKVQTSTGSQVPSTSDRKLTPQPKGANDKTSADATHLPRTVEMKSKIQNSESFSRARQEKSNCHLSQNNTENQEMELTMSFIQDLARKWSSNRMGSPMKPSDIRKILSLSALVKVVSSKMIADGCQAWTENCFYQNGFHASTFLDMYAYSLTKGDGGASVIPVLATRNDNDKVEKKTTLECPPVYLRKILPNSKSGTVLIFEILAIRLQKLKARLVQVRVWALNGIFVNKSSNMFQHQTSENTVGKVKKGCLERQIQVLDNVVNKLQILWLNLEETVINTVMYSLQNEAISQTQHSKDFVNIFRDLSFRFPLRMQRRMKGLKFMMFKSELKFEELVQIDGENIDSREFLNYLCTKASIYGFSNGGVDCNQVLMGPVRGFEKVSMFFLMMGENNKTFDLYLLCQREGNILDCMVTKIENPSYSSRLSEIIYMKAIHLIQETFIIGLEHRRRDVLWKYFVNDFQENQDSIQELNKLLSSSTVTRAFHKDSRFHILLTKFHNLDFTWPTMMECMKADRGNFSHVIKYSFVHKKEKNSRHLLRMHSFGYAFILVDMSMQNVPSDVFIITQVNDKLAHEKCDCAIDMLVTWALQYIWSQVI